MQNSSRVRATIERMQRKAAVFVLLVGLGGCVRIVPYDEVLATVPDEEFIRVENQWVHIERMGEGEPVLLIHGFGGSTFSWRDVAPTLAESFETIAIDLNGFGYTQRPYVYYEYSLLGQVDLVVAILDELSIDSAHLVGHSYGGDVAVVTAALHPDRVRSLALVDGGVVTGEDSPGIPVPLRPFAFLYFRAQILNEAGIRAALEEAVFDPAVVTDEMVAGYLAPLQVEGIDRAFQAFSRDDTINAPPINFGTITQPAIVIWGDHDPVFSTDDALLLAAALPNAYIRFLANTGHLPMDERPEVLSTVLLDFLLDQTDLGFTIDQSLSDQRPLPPAKARERW